MSIHNESIYGFSSPFNTLIVAQVPSILRNRVQLKSVDIVVSGAIRYQ